MRPHQEGAGGRDWQAGAAAWRRAAAAEEEEVVMGRRPLRRSAATEQPLRALKAAEGESFGGDSSDDSDCAPGAENAGSGAEEEGADGRGKGCALWQPWRCSDRSVLVRRARKVPETG